METVDVIVIGAGAIGLAAARALCQAGRDVFIVEAEDGIGTATSSRNSGVIHAGIYYKNGSAKADLCVRGRDLLYRYLRDRGIGHKKCGKMIVATCADDIGKLDAIQSHAKANGVNDLKMLSAVEAIEMEPNLSCHAAILSPSTGILDTQEYLNALLCDAENMGAILATRNTITGGEATPNGIILRINDESIRARTVINAAGLMAQKITASIAGIPVSTIPKQYLAKGNYFSAAGLKPFSRLIYPVPVPGGLGAHYTMNMAGENLFGPDVEWLDTDAYTYDVDAGRIDSFYEAVEKYWPDVRNRKLQPAYAGIRPKIAGSGMPDGDFIIQDKSIHGVDGLINLYGIESPGMTSSLAIAERIAAMARL